MLISEHQQQERARICAELAGVGFILPGSLQARRLTCIHAGCHCHDEPPQLHGPYWYWTRKVSKKTASKMLSAEQVDDYLGFIANERRLRSLVHELEAIGIAILEGDPRTPRRGA